MVVSLEYRYILLYARKTPLFLSASFFMRNSTCALVVFVKNKYLIFRRPNYHNDIQNDSQFFSLQHFVRRIKVKDYIQKYKSVNVFFIN